MAQEPRHISVRLATAGWVSLALLTFLIFAPLQFLSHPFAWSPLSVSITVGWRS